MAVAKAKKTKKATAKAAKKSTSKTKTAVQLEKEKMEQLMKLMKQQQAVQTDYDYERHRIQFKPLIFEKDGQITISEMRKMSLSERHKLWKKLNKGESTRFIPILKHGEASPKPMPMEEAEVRGLLSKKAKGTLYCPYCGDWSHFEDFSYFGSLKCIGCGISTVDFYVRTHNGLWDKK